MAYSGGRGRSGAGNRAGGRGDGRREQRAEQREAYIAQTEERLAAEIARSLEGCREIDGMPARAAAPVEEKAEVAAAEDTAVEQAEVAAAEGAVAEVGEEAVGEPEADAAAEDAAEPAAAPVPTVRVLDQDMAAAILENGRGRAQFCDLAVIDCGSYTNPGGGFNRGYMGQEQGLCESSYLYNVLAKKRDWYGANRRRNINCELYRNRALVVPAVRFTRDKLHAYADVIVVAAPNARRARSEYNVADDTLAAALRDRIRFALAVADELGHDKVVFGAFGCDNAGWDADTVAEALREELAGGEHVAGEVIIAIRNDRFNDNLARFEHAFAEFPAKNEVSYDDVRAERAQAAAAAEAEDDDDDDWRKYL